MVRKKNKTEEVVIEQTQVSRVEATINKCDFDSYQDVLIVGILPTGMIDVQPSIPQYPFVHWILNKTANEIWDMERREVQQRVAMSETDTVGGPTSE